MDSKAEVLTCSFKNDMDVRCVVEGIMFLAKGVNSDKLPRETTVFTINNGVCYHGHSMLNLLDRRGAIIPTIMRDALCEDENGRVLLRSALFIDAFSNIENQPNMVHN
ncbi:hypothetical protein DPMN_038572 [Dreissena polymorpha]|uniref:Uncharacterized protein n=1 Tax=Dreissena polymorpha TaxID=45954 RepID=A0A9D4RNS7_DREPO|nr:hypothetical protein DPMN_038572 [Dreissena polymorpha]